MRRKVQHGMSIQHFSIRVVGRITLTYGIIFFGLIVGLMPKLSIAATEGQPRWPKEQLSGLWEQIDDETRRPQSWVRIVQQADGHFEGLVEKIIPGPGDEPNPKCEKCTDARRNQPVLGMLIITGLRRNDANHYDQGEILDPDTGELYRLKISVLEHGQKLDVRGYLGISLFGRSQYWRRIEVNLVKTK
ncbi:MAG: DUF2147 domain-containing protein [Pseudomonadota bacterium]